eukprot:972590-Prymnesium_polylepis.1
MAECCEACRPQLAQNMDMTFRFWPPSSPSPRGSARRFMFFEKSTLACRTRGKGSQNQHPGHRKRRKSARAPSAAPSQQQPVGSRRLAWVR